MFQLQQQIMQDRILLNESRSSLEGILNNQDVQTIDTAIFTKEVNTFDLRVNRNADSIDRYKKMLESEVLELFRKIPKAPKKWEIETYGLSRNDTYEETNNKLKVLGVTDSIDFNELSPEDKENYIKYSISINKLCQSRIGDLDVEKHNNIVELAFNDFKGTHAILNRKTRMSRELYVEEQKEMWNKDNKKLEHYRKTLASIDEGKIQAVKVDENSKLNITKTTFQDSYDFEQHMISADTPYVIAYFNSGDVYVGVRDKHKNVSIRPLKYYIKHSYGNVAEQLLEENRVLKANEQEKGLLVEMIDNMLASKLVQTVATTNKLEHIVKKLFYMDDEKHIYDVGNSEGKDEAQYIAIFDTDKSDWYLGFCRNGRLSGGYVFEDDKGDEENQQPLVERYPKLTSTYNPLLTHLGDIASTGNYNRSHTFTINQIERSVDKEENVSYDKALADRWLSKKQSEYEGTGLAKNMISKEHARSIVTLLAGLYGDIHYKVLNEVERNNFVDYTSNRLQSVDGKLKVMSDDFIITDDIDNKFKPLQYNPPTVRTSFTDKNNVEEILHSSSSKQSSPTYHSPFVSESSLGFTYSAEHRALDFVVGFLAIIFTLGIAAILWKLPTPGLNSAYRTHQDSTQNNEVIKVPVCPYIAKKDNPPIQLSYGTDKKDNVPPSSQNLNDFH